MTEKTVYLHSPDVARENGELDKYRESIQLNRECAHAIDVAVHECNYELHHYDLKEAAAKVVAEYGYSRTNCVLAAYLQHNEYDGRYSNANKAWANSIETPKQSKNFSIAVINTHPTVLDGFVNATRELQANEKKEPISARRKAFDEKAATQPAKTPAKHKKTNDLEV